MVSIYGQTIPVDIRRELEVFDWHRPSWRHDKLIAASPFRYDHTPSFFVSLEHGGWKDSGAIDPKWTSGNFIRLLSFLRNETYEETADYLLAMYDDSYVDVNRLTLNTATLRIQHNRQPLDITVLNEYKWRHPYLERRGISEAVQRMMRIGYDKQSKAITIPWFTPSGQMANVKYRKVNEKTFWYRKGGLPIRSLVYGMDVIYRKRIKEAVICEAEIDAMTCMTVGIPAIAIGGGTFTNEQAEIIRRSPIESLIIGTDNDNVGISLKKEIINKMSRSVELKYVEFPAGCKDLNDVKVLSDLKKCIKSVKSIVISLSLTLSNEVV